MLAVFDFDGTLSNTYSSLLLFRHMNILQIAKLSLGLAWEKLTGHGDYQKTLVHSLRGMEREVLVNLGKRIDEIETSVELLKKLQDEGHEVLIMSYGLKPLIESFLEHRNIRAEVIAIDLKFEEEKVIGPADDSMTQLLLADPNYAKERIVRLKKIKPRFSVGDNEKRDKHSKHYLAVQSFSGPFFRLKLIFQSIFG